MDKDKKSILEEAANELSQIVETAKKIAKDNLAKELPEKFDTFLNEELKKLSLNKESVKESVEDNKTKEPVNEGKKTDGKKESINEELDMREFSIEEIENVFDQADEEEEFEVDFEPESKESDDTTIDDIADAINSMDDLNNEMEEAQDVGDPYTKFKELAEQMSKIVKEMEDQKMHEDMSAQFEKKMNEIYGEGCKESFGEEKYNELYEMFVDRQNGEPKTEAVNESEKDEPFKDKSNPSNEQGKSIAENEEMDEMHEKVPRGATASPDKGHNLTSSGINEKDEEDENGPDEREEEEKVDEILTNTNAAQRKVQGGHSPNINVAGKHRNPRTRPANRSTNETYEKRMKSLIEENKKLTKEVNNAKKSFDKAEHLVENYKNHLEKYRNQLREMAVFNTNLANVNNLLVNEELALTTKDKISIINKFKNIDSIDESDKTYGGILNEMKSAKKTISENVEEKVSRTIGQSAKQKIDEVIEKTAYQNNEHVNKIKKLMKYVDNRK